MGTKIIETGSTAGGIAKVEYKDELGNVLWYYDDAGNFVRTGNIKIDGNLSGTNNIAIQGTAYNNLENNVKIVQGVPSGGKMCFDEEQTGAIKIKLPTVRNDAMFKFRVKINGYTGSGNKQSNSEYIVKGFNAANGFGVISEVAATCQVTVIKDNLTLTTPTVYFCSGATEDYILIGGITDTHSAKSVVIDDVEIHFMGKTANWSSGWAISLVTTLETLTSQYKVAVTPSLNATHLNGVQETTTATANTIVKRDGSGAITNSQYKLSALNTAPASATATGTTGEIRIDANYIYVCTATNTWKRTALSTW